MSTATLHSGRVRGRRPVRLARPEGFEHTPPTIVIEGLEALVEASKPPRLEVRPKRRGDVTSGRARGVSPALYG